MSQREAFEAALTKARASSTQTDPRFWNTSDAMFWTWQAAIQHARDVADRIQTERAMKSPASDYLEGYNDGDHDCADAIKEALK